MKNATLTFCLSLLFMTFVAAQETEVTYVSGDVCIWIDRELAYIGNGKVIASNEENAIFEVSVSATDGTEHFTPGTRLSLSGEVLVFPFSEYYYGSELITPGRYVAFASGRVVLKDGSRRALGFTGGWRLPDNQILAAAPAEKPKVEPVVVAPPTPVVVNQPTLTMVSEIEEKVEVDPEAYFSGNVRIYQNGRLILLGAGDGKASANGLIFEALRDTEQEGGVTLAAGHTSIIIGHDLLVFPDPSFTYGRNQSVARGRYISISKGVWAVKSGTIAGLGLPEGFPTPQPPHVEETLEELVSFSTDETGLAESRGIFKAVSLLPEGNSLRVYLERLKKKLGVSPERGIEIGEG